MIYNKYQKKRKNSFNFLKRKDEKNGNKILRKGQVTNF